MEHDPCHDTSPTVLLTRKYVLCYILQPLCLHILCNGLVAFFSFWWIQFRVEVYANKDIRTLGAPENGRGPDQDVPFDLII